MGDAVILSLQDITICYGPPGGSGTVVAVDALDLEVQRGEIFGLLGPNGSGKSSTISAIVGALVPESGTITVAGLRETDDPLAYRRHIGLVPQELAIYEDLSAEDNLLFFGRLYGLSGQILRKRVQEVLAFVQLIEQARRPARTYSGGMQRRLNLACALLHEPELILLDEPTVGLDIQSREVIFANLRSLRDVGRTLIFTTHHLEEAEMLCDRLGIMDRGRLLAVGSLAQLCGKLDQTQAEQRTWASYQGLWRSDNREQPHGMHKAPRRSLEEVFLELTGRSSPEA